MTTIDRIFQYLDFKGLKYAPTEKILGLSNGYLGKMRARGASIGSEVIEKIVLHYKDINPEWLLSGKGSMIRGSVNYTMPDNSNYVSEPCPQCELRNKLIAQQEETIELLKYKIDRLSRAQNSTENKDNIKQTG